jgi:hypothetical protein
MTLEAGMTVVVQPNVITKDERAGVQVGELVHITEHGFERVHKQQLLRSEWPPLRFQYISRKGPREPHASPTNGDPMMCIMELTTSDITLGRPRKNAHLVTPRLVEALHCTLFKS